MKYKRLQIFLGYHIIDLIDSYAPRFCFCVSKLVKHRKHLFWKHDFQNNKNSPISGHANFYNLPMHKHVLFIRTFDPH